MNIVSISNGKPSQPGPIRQYSHDHGYRGLDIRHSAQLLRRYACIERALLRMRAGWFLAAPAYETKHTLGYQVWDHAEHVEWIRRRLSELRAGQPNASVEPALTECLAETVHAPDTENFIAACFEIEKSLLDAYHDHLHAADPAANAAEVRILRRMIPDLEQHVMWAEQELQKANPAAANSPHRLWIRSLLEWAGGPSGLSPRPAAQPKPPAHPSPRFSRPATIHFDSRIRRGELMPYEQRKNADAATSTLEDFKVFFNEMYAAALLASVIYDADPSEVPWEFFHDFAHHFWDEVRHSEFGAIRLKELGSQPDVCDPVLYERTQGLPFMHRISYLTLGLETFFMPRKEPRMREFASRGDTRSQLFADQDWSDEITHVRYGKRWLDHLLENDFRTVEDILAEVREHLEKETGQKHEKVAAPF